MYRNTRAARCLPRNEPSQLAASRLTGAQPLTRRFAPRAPLSAYRSQYKYASEFAYKNTYGVKAITKEQYDDLNENKLPPCLDKINACNSGTGNETDCLDAFIFCNTELDAPYVASGLNVYDVRSKGNYKDDLNAVSEFVR